MIHLSHSLASLSVYRTSLGLPGRLRHCLHRLERKFTSLVICYPTGSGRSVLGADPTVLLCCIAIKCARSVAVELAVGLHSGCDRALQVALRVTVQHSLDLWP